MKALPEDVMNQIMEENKVHHEQDSDMTVEKAMAIWNVSENPARRRLDKLVAEEVLEKFDGILKKKTNGCLYRPVVK